MSYRTTKLDRWFWRKLGKRGTVIFNVVFMLTVLALLAVLILKTVIH